MEMAMSDKATQELAHALLVEHIARRVPKDAKGAKIIVNSAWKFPGNQWGHLVKKIDKLDVPSRDAVLQLARDYARANAFFIKNLFPEDPIFSELIIEAVENKFKEVFGIDLNIKTVQ